MPATWTLLTQSAQTSPAWLSGAHTGTARLDDDADDDEEEFDPGADDELMDFDDDDGF